MPATISDRQRRPAAAVRPSTTSRAKARAFERATTMGQAFAPASADATIAGGARSDADRGRRRRAPRNSGTGRRRRRPATAARPAPRRSDARPRAAAAATACVAACRDACRTAPRSPSVAAKVVASPRRSDRPCAIAGRAAQRLRCRPPSAGRRRSSRMRSEGRQRLLGGVGVGRLGIVDEERRAPTRPTCSMRCGEAREGRAAPARSPRSSTPSAARRGDGRRRVLRIVRAAQRADAGEVGDAVARPARRRRTTLRRRRRRRPSASGRSRRDAARRLAAVGVRSRSAIARHQSSSTPMTARVGAGDQPLLDGRVVLHRAVAVEMVRRDVEQDADASASSDGARSIWKDEHLEDMDAVARRAARATGSPCRYCRPSARRARPARRMWAISAVVVDLPLVPVMATNGASGAIAARARGRTARCRR